VDGSKHGGPRLPRSGDREAPGEPPRPNRLGMRTRRGLTPSPRPEQPPVMVRKAARRRVTRISEGRWSGPTCARRAEEKRRNAGLRASGQVRNSHCGPTASSISSSRGPTETSAGARPARSSAPRWSSRGVSGSEIETRSILAADFKTTWTSGVHAPPNKEDICCGA
jgi:hypothetical protein